MKTILSIILNVVVASGALAQGIVNFGNSSSTLISCNGIAMPGSSVSTFYFAVFMAPSTTVTADFTYISSWTAFSADWGPALYTTVNHATGTGRLATTAGAAVIPGYAVGSTVDFIVRGWSANVGTTYAQALAAWNGGGQNGLFGWSRIGNNLILSDGGALPVFSLFGAGGNQVGGFMIGIPEPSSQALTGFGVAALLFIRRRSFGCGARW
ncbi:MAG: hypothetical protein QM813_12465 [Verrucomicrobiota bacterium]